MALGKFLDPKNDFAFKQIFGREKSKSILIPFLNEMLTLSGSEAIQDLKFINPNLDPDAVAKKQSVVDVLCQDYQGRRYIVEMQVAKTQGFEKRAQYYAAKTYSNQLLQGEQYANLKEVIFLALTDFVMFKDNPAYKSDHVILDKNTHQQELKDLVFTFLELPKFTKKLNELETVTDRWLYFFKHAEHTLEQDVKQIVGGQKEIAQAYEVLNRFSWTENELKIYEQEEKSERDLRAMIAAGKAEGEVKGRVEEKRDIAFNLLKAGVDESVITRVTGFSKSEIDALRKQI